MYYWAGLPRPIVPDKNADNIIASSLKDETKHETVLQMMARPIGTELITD